jgi:hypothetical protein
MTTRQKTGVGFMIGGGLSVTVGVVFMTLETSPIWINVLLKVVPVLAEAIGFAIVYPNEVRK